MSLLGGAAAALLVGGGGYFAVAALVDRTMVQPRLALAVGARKRIGDSVRIAAEGVDQVKTRLSKLAVGAGRLMPLTTKDREKIAVNLHRAGYRSANALTIMLGIKFACLLSGFAIGMVVATPLAPEMFGLLAGLVAGLFGGVLLNVVPELLLRQLVTRRLRNVNTGFAETLDLLVVCLESGLTFDTALKRTIDNLKELHAALAREYRQVMLDMSVHGRSRADALRNLADRVDSQPYRDLAITVAQAERHGTPLGEALRRLASSARVDAMTHMQAKMARLPTLLIIPSVTCILPGILVIVGGPAIQQLTANLGNIGG
ncbi:MAG: type II secretion system F family protein [Gammaproteobacteria bacterium]|nr:type II secretion system F family protein [Gammaproteobacteria bacterium]